MQRKQDRLFMTCPKHSRIRLRYSFSLCALPGQSGILVSLVCPGENAGMRGGGDRRRQGEKKERGKWGRRKEQRLLSKIF